MDIRSKTRVANRLTVIKCVEKMQDKNNKEIDSIKVYIYKNRVDTRYKTKITKKLKW